MSGGAGPFDREAMLAELAGDGALLDELIETLRAEAPKLLLELRAAVGSGDAARVARAAHTLKGAVSNFGAAAATDAARRLEQQARAGELRGAAAALAEIEREMQALAEALRRA